MKRLFCLALSVVLLFPALSRAEKKQFPYRWLFAFDKVLDSDQKLEDMRGLVKICAEHGINGIVMQGQMDRLEMKTPEYFARLHELNKLCIQNGIELIPTGMSAAWGDGVFLRDKNMAAGLPVKDAQFVVKEGQATLVSDHPVQIVNGGFEETSGKKIAGFTVDEKAVPVMTVDKKEYKEGRKSLCFNVKGNFPPEGRLISQEVAVKPYRCYRLECWVKIEVLENAWGAFPLHVRGIGEPNNRNLLFTIPDTPPDRQWHKVVMGFNTVNYDKVSISVSTPAGKNAKFWVDGLAIEEVGLVNVLRRPGTPVTVKGEESGIVYEEGRDYFRIEDPEVNIPFDNKYPFRNYRFDHPAPPVRLTTGSRMKEGERLRVSYYHPMVVYRGQVTLCLSEPKLYELWREKMKVLYQAIAPKKYLLSMDEVRAGGTCAACKARGMTMAQIIGDCITRQTEIIRSFDPEIEVFIWSDMIDPNHNAGDRAPAYYHVNENYYGSWNYVPKDLNIMCWYHTMRKKSLPHFTGLGHKVMAGVYYDSGQMEHTRDWINDLRAMPNALGLMYCSWNNDYRFLAEFGDLASEPF